MEDDISKAGFGSNNLGINKSTIQRTVSLFLTSGNVKKKSYPTPRSYTKLTYPAKLHILHLLIEKPFLYLDEIQDNLRETLFINISLATISRFLQKNGFTRQRLQRVASQQDSLLRLQFYNDMALFKQDMFIYIDETGADRRNAFRRYGYSLRGVTPRSYIFSDRGNRISVIAMMSTRGLLDIKTIQGTTNAVTFYEFILTHLIPHILPYNGLNHHSVVILDNCSVHHVAEIVETINDTGALLYFLPPYSPDLNPIEELFAKVKLHLKRNDNDIPADFETQLFASFASVTKRDCLGWINHCGIYTQNE